MTHVDTAKLVSDALRRSGCDPSRIDILDAHSTIAIDFNAHPSIYVSREGSEVWLSSPAGERDGLDYVTFDGRLLVAMSDSRAWTVLNTPLFFSCSENIVYVNGRLAAEYIADADLFREALNDFFDTGMLLVPVRR